MDLFSRVEIAPNAPYSFMVRLEDGGFVDVGERPNTRLGLKIIDELIRDANAGSSTFTPGSAAPK